MVARTGLAGAPVLIRGMHPEEPALSFDVPPPPSIAIEVQGERVPVTTQLTNFVIFPAQKKFYVVYCAGTGRLPRDFVPAIHAHIPIFSSVDGDPPIHYVTPPTTRERLAAANQQ